jgi:hypothetical protein
MLEREGCVVPEKVDSADIVISSEIRVEDARGRGALKFMSWKRWLRSFLIVAATSRNHLSRKCFRSAHFDACGFDDLGPLLRIFGNQLRKVRR